jgi:ABC-type nitrate/sulfonate/bicarbonate transport system substrate-binding protein
MRKKLLGIKLGALLFALCSSAEAQEGKKIPWIGYLAGSGSAPNQAFVQTKIENRKIRMNSVKARNPRCWFILSLIAATLLSVWPQAGLSATAHPAQKELQKLTVGYTPIAGASLPFFIAVEEKIFQKYGFEILPVFMGGSPLINAAILSGEFPIGYTGGGAVIASRLSGSDLIAIASPLPVLTIDGWSKPEIKSISDLRGKRVGVTRFGASSYFSALSMLESGGVKPSEVTFIQNGGVEESFAALTGGRVDVCMKLATPSA